MSVTAKWSKVLEDGLLKRCYFLSATFRDSILMHGGLTTPDHKGQPLNSLISVNPSSCTVTLLSESGPSLSHHDGFITGDNLLVVVGGWDGRHRSSHVHVYALDTDTWIHVRHDESVSRPPTGLSGHTATKINSNLACILGREGGIKIQRKFGDIFLLNFQIVSREENSGASEECEGTGSRVCIYWYEEAPVKTKSRSGHTAVLAPSLRYGGDLYGLFVFGGRDDESVHKCGQWDSSQVSVEMVNHEQLYDQVTNVVDTLDVSKPTALRYHTMAMVNSRCILIQGGENFQARSNISSDLLICVNKKERSCWYRLAGSGEGSGRSAHQMSVLGSAVYLAGGLERHNNRVRLRNDLVKLSLEK